MLGNQFTEIVAIVKQAELGMAVGDIVRQLCVSQQTLYRWKNQYKGSNRTK